MRFRAVVIAAAVGSIAGCGDVPLADDLPRISIAGGSVHSPPPDDPLGVIGGVALSGDSVIFIVDGQDQAVVRLRIDGSDASRFSRRGEGPGELRSAFSVFVQQNTVVVPDFAARQINRFGLRGDFLGADPGYFNRSHLVEVDRVDFDSHGTHYAQYRYSYGTVDDRLVRWGGVSVEVDTLALLPRSASRGGGQISLLSARPLWDAGPTGVVAVTSTHGDSVTLLDGVTGRTLRTFGLLQTGRLRTASEDYQEWIREAVLGSVPPEFRSNAERSLLVGDSLPRLDGIRVAASDEIWVQRVLTEDEHRRRVDEGLASPVFLGSESWEVYSSSGEPLMIVKTPIDFGLVGISGGYLYGVNTDSLGVQSVQLLPTAELQRGRR